MPADDDRAELLRQFESALAGAELADLRRLAADLSLLGAPQVLEPEREEHRRPRPAEPTVLRVRVELDRSRPPIWRLLDLRSDLGLDVVHQVLQAAFGWSDSHLHRFSVGGGPFDGTSQLFLCPYDVEDGEDEGTPDTEVSLDELLQHVGDVLHYVYDYGDCWELTLRVEQVLPLTPGAPAALCVDGRRAAPPEDCGGRTDVADLIEVLPDPARFDVAEVNEALKDPFLALREAGLHPGLVDLVTRLRFSSVGDDLVARALALTLPGPQPDEQARRDALAAHTWFLERAGGDGIPLTAAGYLTPADVEAASPLVPSMTGWIGKRNREIQTYPVLLFRESLQQAGLLRKHKGRLLLTRVGATCRRDVNALWTHLASRAVPDPKDRLAHEAALLVLLHAATTRDRLRLDLVAEALGDLGWQRSDGEAIDERTLSSVAPSPVTLLENVGPAGTDRPSRRELSPHAAALARAALRET